ncbi:MAG: hypothetical protein WBF13_12495 [Candidatus Zixiibacteriota bacterium]
MRPRTCARVACAAALASSVIFGGCDGKRCTSPVDIGPFLMTEYFPLNHGDEWIWEVVVDSTPLIFVDGDLNLGEPFVDSKRNGKYDPGEDYEDLNSNGKYDGPNDLWSPGVPYEDRNSNGRYDPPNGEWDEGEIIINPDSLGVEPWPRPLHGSLKAGMDAGVWISSVGSVVFGRRSFSLGPPGWYLVIRYTDDGFSNDSLGLRWHSHTDIWGFSVTDDLKDHAPIVIAKAVVQLGDSVTNEDTTYIPTCPPGFRTWTSVFEGLEDVTVPAGEFRHCLKFKSVARGWTGNMQEYNGTSCQWYAKNVGLVRLEKPAEGLHWQLDSASVGGTSYP